MTNPDDWTDLTAAWTAPTDQPAPPVADVVRRVRRRAGWARANFYVEIIGCVIAAAIGVWASLDQGSWLIAVAAVAFCGVALGLTLWAWGGGVGDPADTPEQALRAALKQAQSGLRWARAGQLLGPVAIVFVLIIAWDETWRVRLAAMAALAVFMLVFGLFYERHARRAKARITQAQAALAELENDV